jgi:hypothetical protein
MGTSPRMTEENFQAVRAFRNECLDRHGTILLVALFLSLKRPSLMPIANSSSTEVLSSDFG